MRGKGMTYDTGFVGKRGTVTHRFDPAVVKRELTIIRDDLHCNAVQIIGGVPERLALAAGYAADIGMEVWFSPYPLDLTGDEILSLFADCARRAELLRQRDAEVVFVAGVELSIMNRGFVPGETLQERLGFLLTRPERRQERLADAGTRLNDFFTRAVPVIREHFRGRITYAAIPFERIDWTPFDIVSLELIRSAEVADRFREGVRSIVAGTKPVAITGFGTAAWRGAGEVAPRSMEIVEYDENTGAPVRLNGEYGRDENGQAGYLTELLEIFDAEGVDSTFVFLFALDDFPHRPDGDPRDDLDLASPGIVKVVDGRHGTTYPDMSWEPKAAFSAVAECYRD
jgi:hypothetical protein